MIGGRLKKIARRKASAPFAALCWLLCFLALFFLFRIYVPGFKKSERQKPSVWLEQRAAGMTAAIWRQWYPMWGEQTDLTVGSSSGEAGAFSTSGVCGWLLRCLVKQTPYYRYIEGEHKHRVPGEMDPAYADYLENHEALEEYEYLVDGLSESAVMASGKNPLADYPAGEAGGVSPGAAGAGGNSGAGVTGNVTENGTGSGTGAAGDAEGGGTKNSQAAQTAQSGAPSAGARPSQVSRPAGAVLLQKAGRPAVGTEYIPEQLADYDFLMKHFYTVHPTTTAGRDMMKADTFLSEDFALPPADGKPQILIYHTHSQEEYVDFHKGNRDATVVGVGSYLTELLTAKGYHVIHDKTVYDLKDGKLDRSKAYSYSLDGITGILQKNPSIQVVLDIHRDGVKEGTRLVQEINGKPTAMIMFFNGTSQSPTGPIEYLENPYRTDNMAFSFQMKLCADAFYPGFTRKIYLKGLRYNMQLRPRSALIEVGAQTNTYEEAKNAMEPLADLLDMVLKQ